MKKKITIEIDEEMLGVISSACEHMSRFLSGQVNIPDILVCSESLSIEQVTKLQSIDYDIKKIAFPELSTNQSYGIAAKGKCEFMDEYRKRLYDFYRTCKEFRAKEDGSPSGNVYSSVGRNVSDLEKTVIWRKATFK